MSKGHRVGKFPNYIGIMVLSALFSVLCGVKPAYAQCIPGVPCVGATAGSGTTASMSTSRACDADFMNQITARAALEAQREVISAQSNIHKPDSVLEYSCFDSQISNAANVLPKAFSTADSWDGHSVPLTGGFTIPKSVTLRVNMGDGHGDGFFEDAILKPVRYFIARNFGHAFMGGQMGIDHTPSASIASGPYTCGNMAIIWHAAKCDDFSAGFFKDFDSLVSGDPRDAPGSCGGTSIDTGTIALANNAAPTFQYAAMDKIETHFDLIKAPGHELSPNCGTPYPTGVEFPMTVSERVGANNQTIRDVRWVDEYICPNPSCRYNRASGRCVP